MVLSSSEDQQENLERFEASLKIEYEAQLEELKKKIEDEIAEAIAARRRKIELEVDAVRVQHQTRFEQQRRQARLKLENQARRNFLNCCNDLVKRVESEIEERLITLRSDPERYGRILNVLIQEGTSVIGAPVRVVIDSGEMPLVDKSGLIVEVEELDMDSWGGCLLIQAEKGEMIVDNTFRTRWRKLFPQVASQLFARVSRDVEWRF